MKPDVFWIPFHVHIDKSKLQSRIKNSRLKAWEITSHIPQGCTAPMGHRPGPWLNQMPVLFYGSLKIFLPADFIDKRMHYIPQCAYRFAILTYM